MAGRLLGCLAMTLIAAALAGIVSCSKTAGSGLTNTQPAAAVENRTTSTPAILALDPPAQQAGAQVAIHGADFGMIPGIVLLDGEPQDVQFWNIDRIEVIFAGAPGVHELVVEDDAGQGSQPVAVTILEDLFVEVTGIDEHHVYRFDEPRPVTIATNPDTETVKLQFYNYYGREYSAPFGAAELPISGLPNGTHPFSVRAERLGVTVEGPTLMLTLYTFRGDVDADGWIDMHDRDALVSLVGLTSDAPEFKPWFDCDDDGLVSEADLSYIGYLFGTGNIPAP